MENESNKIIPAELAKRISLLCAFGRRKDEKNGTVINTSVSLVVK
jgi:uncharacterized protein Veg